MGRHPALEQWQGWPFRCVLSHRHAVARGRAQPAAPGSEVVVPRVLDQLQRTLDPTRAPAQQNPGQPLFAPVTPGNPAGSSGTSGGT